MSEAQKAAEAYVKETDYIDDLNRNLAGNAFLAGAAWQRERDAKLAESHFGSESISVDTRRIHSNDTALSIAKLIREQTFDAPPTKGETT